MNFKEWLNTTGFITSIGDEYDSGLFRSANFKPVDLNTGPKDKIDRIFGMRTEDDIHDKGAGIFFTNGEKVLILKRKAPSEHAGTWCLPGGHAKKGESPLQNAMREAQEECGYNHGENIGYISRDGWWTTFFFLVDSPFDCNLNSEHSQYKWVPIKGLKNWNLLPEFKNDLPIYLEKLKKLL